MDEHILKVGLYLGELISGWTYNQVCYTIMYLGELISGWTYNQVRYTCTWVGLCQGGLIIRCAIHVLGWAYTQGGLILRDGLILSMGLFSGELILRVVLYLGWAYTQGGLILGWAYT